MLTRLPLKFLNRSREHWQSPAKAYREYGEGKTRNRREGKERTLESFCALHLSKNRFSVCLWVCLCLSFLWRLWMETCLFKCFGSRACAPWAWWFLKQDLELLLHIWGAAVSFSLALQLPLMLGQDSSCTPSSFLKSTAAFSKISVESIVLSRLCFLQVRCLNTSTGGSLSLWFKDWWGVGCIECCLLHLDSGATLKITSALWFYKSKAVKWRSLDIAMTLNMFNCF